MTDHPLTVPLAAPTGLAAWVTAIRPKQWAKNVLVFAAPGAAAAFGSEVIRNVGVTFLAFCAVASAVYLTNDSFDVERDRAHPRKRLRPIAAGTISVASARLVALFLFVLGLGLAYLVNSGVLFLVGTYVAATLGYSAGLKHQPVIDVILVASGFVIRAAAGGVAAGVAISSWFLLVTSFGALLIVSGKRYAEFVELVDERSSHRPSLGSYTAEFLRALVAVSAGMAIITYCLWALENSPESYQHLLLGLSIIPFLAALLRYVLLVMTGAGGEPEEIFLADRPLQVMGFVWLAVFGAGVLLGG
jgi:decaprenyl-phosphate phosphoribosyltransferase